MKYKRLTNGHIVNGYVCNDKEETVLCDCNCLAMWNRLQELEDKIENGTLIELPYMYEITKDREYRILYKQSNSVEFMCDTIFSTTGDAKEQAEARLKELTSKDGE